MPDLTRTRRTCIEPEFQGIRSTSGHGQIAATFFKHPRWVDIEGWFPQDGVDIVFPRSYNEVGVMWPALRHVNQYRRVDVAEMLHPDCCGTEIRDL